METGGHHVQGKEGESAREPGDKQGTPLEPSGDNHSVPL